MIHECEEDRDRSENRFSCTKCGRRYKQKVTLVRHLRYECGITPQFPCPLCTYRAKHRAHLEHHLRYRHPAPAPVYRLEPNLQHLHMLADDGSRDKALDT
ncbi:hypothetical protein J6590_014819 [Homalodisca vitripennis]|nr:hypothetical protein J6590_014819 [Homalodisca vitripennis]